MLDVIIGFFIEMAKIAFIKMPLAIIGLILIVLMWYIALNVLSAIFYYIYHVYCWLFKRDNDV